MNGLFVATGYIRKIPQTYPQNEDANDVVALHKMQSHGDVLAELPKMLHGWRGCSSFSERHRSGGVVALVSLGVLVTAPCLSWHCPSSRGDLDFANGRLDIVALHSNAAQASEERKRWLRRALAPRNEAGRSQCMATCRADIARVERDYAHGRPVGSLAPGDLCDSWEIGYEGSGRIADPGALACCMQSTMCCMRL